MLEIESKELRSCADCMVGQGRGCRCATVDPLPSGRCLVLLALTVCGVVGTVVWGVARFKGRI